MGQWVVGQWDMGNKLTQVVWIHFWASSIKVQYDKAEVTKTYLMGEVSIPGQGLQLVPRCQPRMAGHLAPGLATNLGSPFNLFNALKPGIYVQLQVVSGLWVISEPKSHWLRVSYNSMSTSSRDENVYVKDLTLYITSIVIFHYVLLH